MKFKLRELSGRSSFWTFDLTVDGNKMAGGSASNRADIEREATHYGWQYAAEGDCVVTIRRPKGIPA